MKINMEIPEELKIEIPFDPVIYLLGLLLKERHDTVVVPVYRRGIHKLSSGNKLTCSSINENT